MSATALVIGGGISGLAAAVQLRDDGFNVQLVEASERLGGPIYTEYRDGYIIDAGPDSFLSTKPGGIAFAQRLGIATDLINTNPDGGGTYIVRDSRMAPLPEGITMLVPTQFRQILASPLLDLHGKLRLLTDYFLPARQGDRDESVASFMRRRVGAQAFENLAEPLLSGIFAGDASKLSILATFPRLREAEQRHGGLIRAALAGRRLGQARPQSRYTPFVSFRTGLGSLVSAAASRIGEERTFLDTRIESIERRMDGSYSASTTDGRTFEADAVVLATPAGVSAQLLASLAPAASRALGEICYVSSATVSMGFSERDVSGHSGGRGFVVPRVEGFELTAATWSSRKFAERAPEGHALLRGFVGRAGNEAPAFLPDDRVIATVRRDLAAITGLSADPLFARVYRWHNAMPQYHVGHRERVDSIQQEIRSVRGLALVGAAYHGVGIPDCIASTTEVARGLALELGIQTSSR